MQSSCIPWLVTCDKTLVAMIGDASEKKLQTLADCMCDTVKNKGITELRVIDHTMAARTVVGYIMSKTCFVIEKGSITWKRV